MDPPHLALCPDIIAEIIIVVQDAVYLALTVILDVLTVICSQLLSNVMLVVLLLRCADHFKFPLPPALYMGVPHLPSGMF